MLGVEIGVKLREKMANEYIQTDRQIWDGQKHSLLDFNKIRYFQVTWAWLKN